MTCRRAPAPLRRARTGAIAVLMAGAILAAAAPAGGPEPVKTPKFYNANRPENANAVSVTFLLIALTINPLAAYAMSRFNLRGQDLVLLYLLATMAFPAMVSAIPPTC